MGYSPWGRKELDMTKRHNSLKDIQQASMFGEAKGH